MLCSSATWSILHRWELKYKDRCQLLNLPEKGHSKTSIAAFVELQTSAITAARNIFINEFCKKDVTEIYREEIESYSGNEYYIRKFCEANVTLLQNLLRATIYTAIESYRQFLLSFASPELRPVAEIIQDERDNPVTYQF